MFEHLLLPGQIGRLKLKNRMKFTATTTNYCGEGGEVTDRELAFMLERAKGGAAIVSSGGGYPDILGRGYRNQMGLHDDRLIPGLNKLAQGIKGNGAVAVGQIMHTGRYAQPAKYGIKAEPVGPTAMAPKLPHYAPCRGLTTDEVKGLVEAYGRAAGRIKKAGFDAVDIGVMGGYLPTSFLCPAYNRRTDEYGGSLENRARFIVEIIKRIKAEVGTGYPVTIKMLATDLLLEGGNTEEEYIEVARMCEDAGVDAISLAVGIHESDLPAITAEIESGHWVYLAANWKKAGIKVPLLMSYRLSKPEVAERAIAEGALDFWEMCRPMIADPYLPTKVAQGRPEEIAVCIADADCIAGLFVDQPVACTVNPRAGRELDPAFRTSAATTKRKIMVVGGGPAGMEAAATASLRGHRVTLYESAEKLGGQLLQASVGVFKDEIAALKDYLALRVVRSGVDVKLNSRVTAQTVKRLKPDVVVVAAGSTPIVPDIPGINHSKVVTAVAVLAGGKPVGDRVVIIGGGMIGCEIAEFLVRQGKKVTILEARKHIGQDIGPFNRWRVLQRLQEARVGMETTIEVKEIVEDGVVAGRGGTTQLFAADSIVLAAGMKPDKELYQQLKGEIPEVYMIGDCVESRTIGEAIEEGARIGATL